MSMGTVRGETGRPSVGAIRWDAWMGGEVMAQVERTLGPARYHDRLPWFAEVVDAETVRIDGGRQAVMDREIGFAAAAGLDYWAFLLYPEGNSMSVGLTQYLASRERTKLGFCLILHNAFQVPEDRWPRECERAVALLQEPGYQSVLGGRPLVYTFFGGAFPHRRFDEFLAAARAKGLNPYCVYMGWDPAGDYRQVGERGFAAVSAYAKAGSQATFAELVATAEQDWEAAAKATVPYVPLVTTGWDKWPRKDHPVSWEKGQSYHQQTVFPSRAKPAEIASHLKRSLAFVGEHRAICPANTVIVYAWNEYDEGGWLAPTRGADGQPDASRLEAVRTILDF